MSIYLYFYASLIVSVVAMIASTIGIGLIIANRKHEFLQKFWICFLVMLIGVFGCGVALVPVGAEEYSSEVTVMRTENVNDEWVVYFNDNGNIRSVRCEDTDSMWFDFIDGERVTMKYGKVNYLIKSSDDTYHCVSISKVAS